MFIDLGGGVPGPPPGPPAPITNLPSFSAPVPISTLSAGGRFISTEKSFGDYQIGIITVSGVRKYLMVGNHFGEGLVAVKTYDGNPYEGWPATAQPSPPHALLIQPGTPCSGHLDTFTFGQSASGQVTALYTANPGSITEGEIGRKWCLQRATSTNPTAASGSWTRYGTEILLSCHPDAPWEGPTSVDPGPPEEFDDGIAEWSHPIYEPLTDEWVLFYVGKLAGQPPDAWGDTEQYRIGRATCPAAIFDSAPVWTRTPVAAADSFIWTPEENGFAPGQSYTVPPAAGTWGTNHSPLQIDVIRFPDGSYHMVFMNKRPNTLITPENLTAGLGFAWSLDQGMTWTCDVNDPVVTGETFSAYFDPDTPGWTPNWLNSAHFMLDTDHPSGQVRLYLHVCAGLGIYAVNGIPYIMETTLST